MTQRRELPRRTFLQERLEILIKRQKNGTATFNELTELDMIVNSDLEIRKQIIEDMMDNVDYPTDKSDSDVISTTLNVKRQNFLSRLKNAITKLIKLQFFAADRLLTFN